ncbi:carbohydrate ABC transporter permease [Geodermatophilus sabuli]|uniref:Carbohydrate ABC transporter membrane protein 2, CUT1 family n=1 Tax=Geodermatophilus sabuli TaxID=1564158 RepID=A0A285EGD1_9ACTN|nr:carbohydrate ABC transporter permease [Geodermatophilus sabuli]MBB3086443.1 multiple sugar transport system permease protein [Geodermatophilus sabuli]SNX97903.1 carbohydrate ABC transporter membrane protein 2, CUT1 family [Geodermatophilus sabuli]
MSSREKTWWWIGGLLIVVYCLFPIAWIVSLSFKAPSDIANGQFLPSQFTWRNYSDIFTGTASDLFLPALRNSFGICLIATAISCILAMFAAYAIARLDFPGKTLILSTALGVAIFPVISIVTPLFNVWRQIGLYDTWLGLIIPYLSLTLPISIWTMSAFFREIPWEMEQAAQVDGATTWQAFRKVIVPLAAPGVFTTAIIAFFIAWNDFVYGISLTSTSASRPVPAALGLFSGASQFEDPTTVTAAAAVVVTIPVVVLVLLFQRRIVAGLTNGAVKG